MTRRFYQIAIFFIALIIINGCYFGIQYFHLGLDVFEKPFYPSWFKTHILLNLIATIVVARYYHFRRFMVNYYLSIGYLVLLVPEYFLDVSLQNGGAYGTNNKIMAIALILLGITYGISLFRSNAKSRPYLKVYGKIIACWASLTLILYISIISTDSTEIENLLQLIFQVMEPIGQFLPVFYILNFQSEIKELPGISMT